MLLGFLPLLATNNADMIATIVIIVAAVIIMSFVILALALAAFYANKKDQTEKKAAAEKAVRANKPATAKQRDGGTKKQSAKAAEKPADGAGAIYCEMPLIFGLYVSGYRNLLLEYHPPLLLPYTAQPALPSVPEQLLLGGERQLAIAEHAEVVEQPADEGLTLKESIALAVAAASKHININKATVAAWLTENYSDVVKLNRRENRTKTGLPLADTHYVIKKGKQKCFIYVYDLTEEKSMLLLRADYKTAEEIIEQYPSVMKSRFPKSTTEQWCTLIPDIGFETEQQIYDIIALIIARLVFGENAEPVKQPVEVAPPAEEPVQEEEGLTLKESIALAAAAVPKHIIINKTTVAAWLTENYGEIIKLNRRENRTKTGLPLADTHYVIKNGKQKCFIYVYELKDEKSLLLLKADRETAAELIERYPSINKSRFPKSSSSQWCTLIPDIGFDNEQQIYDIIATIIARLAFGEKAAFAEKPPVEVVPAEESVEIEETATQAAVGEAPAEVAVAAEEETVEEAEEEERQLTPEEIKAEEEARGITLKESLELAAANSQVRINKTTVAVWLEKKYGERIVSHRRENRIQTGLPLADTHYVTGDDKPRCFLYVYELDDDKSFLLLKTDGITAAEIAEKHPSFVKSRFPKSKFEQWYTLIPDMCYKNAKEVFDIIELVLSRYLEKDESKVLYEKVYEKRRGRRKPGKKFAVNCDTLAKNYLAGETVDIKSLKNKGIVPKGEKQIKILARGALTKPLTIIADDFSKEAVFFISKIGGTPILTD